MSRGVLLPILALLSVALTGVFVRDLWHASNLPSGCEMTYSWPVYTPLAWPKTSHHKYALYSVHMHEQREELTGVPVLFLPGHLGSYKQARSIARHLFDADATLFDVFALDFRSELTGLSGDFVAQQAQYVNTAIRAILRQYKKQHLSALKKHSKGKRGAVKPSGRPPTSVVIVAHSMGGIVARVAETLPNYVPQSIQHVVSLGTPHDRAPFPFDVTMQRAYSAIAGVHVLSRNVSAPTDAAAVVVDTMTEEENTLDAPVYISIAGGHKDTIVHASLSGIDRMAHPQHAIASLTTAMPGVALTMDHLCLLWCHQLLARVAQSLVSVVDLDARALVASPRQRLAAARKVLLRGDIAMDTTDVDDDATSVLRHQTHVRDGYHPLEFARYAIWTPQLLFHVLRAQYATLFVVLYALALHILSLQLTHWQRAFGLQTTATNRQTTQSQPKFPSFTTLLHPREHVLLPLTRAFAALTGRTSDDDADANTSTRTIAMLVAGTAAAAAIALETGRRNAVFAAQYGFLLELAILYVYALGLLYTLALLLSVVRALVVSPIVTALHRVLATRAKKVRRWMFIGAIVAVVVAAGHIESVMPFRLVATIDAARTVALLVLASFAVFVLYLVALGGNVSTSLDQQRFQQSLFAVYALSLVPWIGHVLVYVDIVRFPPPVLSNALLLQSCVHVVVLTLARYVMTCSQEWMLPMPPTAFFGAATGQDAAALYDSDRSVKATNSSSSAAKITAENCPNCVFEDGGPGAIFIEFTNADTQRLRCQTEVVLVGPSFRVVACDCVTRFASRPRDYCAFCLRSCQRCGGGAGNVQQATQYKDFVVETQYATALHALVPLLLEALALAQLSIGLRCEHWAFYMTPVCSLALLVYHVALVSPVEAKRRKNKLNKANKKKKRKSKTKTKTSSSSNGPAAAGATPPVTVKVSASTAKTTTANSNAATSKTNKSNSKTKQTTRPPNPNVPESLFVNPIYEMVDDDDNNDA